MILGVIALASVVVLLAWDVFPRQFSADFHNLLGAFPLVTIAFAYIVYQSAHRPGRNGLIGNAGYGEEQGIPAIIKAMLRSRRKDLAALL